MVIRVGSSPILHTTSKHDEFSICPTFLSGIYFFCRFLLFPKNLCHANLFREPCFRPPEGWSFSFWLMLDGT